MCLVGCPVWQRDSRAYDTVLLISTAMHRRSSAPFQSSTVPGAKSSSHWASSRLMTPGHGNAGRRLIGQAHRVKGIVQGPGTGSVQEDRSGPCQGTGGRTLVHTQIA